jgi:hypothetical protein
MNAVRGSPRRGYPGAFAALLALALVAGGVWQLVRPWFAGAREPAAPRSPFVGDSNVVPAVDSRTAAATRVASAAFSEAPSDDLPPGCCEIVVRVVDREGRPVPGALVGLVGASTPVVGVADDEGVARLRTSQTGGLVLHAAERGLYPAEERVELVADRRSERTVVLAPAVALRVRAFDERNRPLVGARAQLFPAGGDPAESFEAASLVGRACRLNDDGEGTVFGRDGLSAEVQIVDAGHSARGSDAYLGRRIPVRFGAEPASLDAPMSKGRRVRIELAAPRDGPVPRRLDGGFLDAKPPPAQPAAVRLLVGGADPCVFVGNSLLIAVPPDAEFELELLAATRWRFAETTDPLRSGPLRVDPPSPRDADDADRPPDPSVSLRLVPAEAR